MRLKQNKFIETIFHKLKLLIPFWIVLWPAVSPCLEHSVLGLQTSSSESSKLFQKSALAKLVEIEAKIEDMKKTITVNNPQNKITTSTCAINKATNSFRIRELEIKVYQIRNLHNEIMFLDDSIEIGKLSKQAEGILHSAEGICQASNPSYEKLIIHGSY